MKTKLQDLVNLIDRGEIGAARLALAELWQGSFDRESALTLAHCARRVQAPEKALRLLHGHVIETSTARVRKSAKPEEISEYAIALSELGASREALRLLAEVPLETVPMCGIHAALTQIRLWDWKEAEKELLRVLALPKIEQNHEYYAQVYLGSCMLHGHFNIDDSDRHLEKLIKELETTHYGILLRSARLLRAQALCLKGDHEGSEKLLMSVREHAERRKAPDAFEITNKWLALNGLFRDGPNPTHLAQLAHAREQLQRLNRWERVRGCDYYLALVTKDQALIDRLRAGTPYPAFQERLNTKFGPAAEESLYAWDIPHGDKYRHGAMTKVDPFKLKPGQLLQRLLLALSSDFYRPFKLVELHELVFPGEYFNPDSSVLKIHQAMSRLRAWLKSENIPLVLSEKRETYSLLAHGPCQMNVFLGGKEAHPQARPVIVQAVESLAKGLQGEFGITDAIRVLAVPRRTAIRYLSEATEQGLLEKRGKGKLTRYVVK